MNIRTESVAQSVNVGFVVSFGEFSTSRRCSFSGHVEHPNRPASWETAPLGAVFMHCNFVFPCECKQSPIHTLVNIPVDSYEAGKLPTMKSNLDLYLLCVLLSLEIMKGQKGKQFTHPASQFSPSSSRAKTGPTCLRNGAARRLIFLPEENSGGRDAGAATVPRLGEAKGLVERQNLAKHSI